MPTPPGLKPYTVGTAEDIASSFFIDGHVVESRRSIKPSDVDDTIVPATVHTFAGEDAGLMVPDATNYD